MAKPTKHLTDKGVEAVRAPVGKDREYITDTGPGSAKGLNLMVTAKGSKSWVWRSRHPLTSKQVKKTLGNYPELGPRAAKAIPGATLVTFEDLGHSPQIQDPERFHEALLTALKR